MNGRAYTWKGGWRASPRRIMRGMGLTRAQIRRTVAAKPPAPKRPQAKKTPARTVRVPPRTKTATARR